MPLPKKVFTALVGDLKRIKADWDQDRLEKPNLAPYEVDSQIASLIRHHMREIRASGDTRKDTLIVEEFIAYMIKQGTLMKSPYGGTMFKIDVATIPAKEELVKQIHATIDKLKG